MKKLVQLIFKLFFFLMFADFGQTLNIKLDKSKGEDRGKPSLKRTRREDVTTHTAIKLKDKGGGANKPQGSVLMKLSEEIDQAIEEALVKDGREQYEREVLKEIQQFDGRTRNGKLWQSIQRLQRLVKIDPTNVAVKAQLRSKRRKLQSNTTSSPVSTPAESEEENPTEDEWADKRGWQAQPQPRRINSEANTSNKTKLKLKIVKAAQVTILDDKALQTNEKKYKKLKPYKDDELAEMRVWDAQSGNNTAPSNKPAAFMPARNLQQAKPHCWETGHHSEGSTSCCLSEAAEEEPNKPTNAWRTRPSPKLAPKTKMHAECLKGGSQKKRKKLEVDGDWEENKSKHKPQDFKASVEDTNGLVNLGNTCYLNAVLQCLARCPALLTTLDKTEVANDSITSHLREVCTNIILETRTEPLNPSDVHSAIMNLDACSKWEEDEQQDAADLLQIIIEQLQEENKQIGKLFEGSQRSSMRCRTCEEISKKDEKFTIVSLNLDKNKELENLKVDSTWKESRDSIEELIEKYHAKEHLRAANKVRCTKCNSLQEADKSLEFMEIPKILITHLKRYKKNEPVCSESTGNGTLPIAVEPTKLKQHIVFHRKMEIKRNDLQGIISGTESYELRGVIVHYGAKTNVGHYKAFVNNNETWTEWNDQTGTPIPWNAVRNMEAYILFWERKPNRASNEPKEVPQKRPAETKVEEKENSPSDNPIKASESNAKAVKEMELDPENTKRKREDEPAENLSEANSRTNSARTNEGASQKKRKTKATQTKAEEEDTPKTVEENKRSTRYTDLEAIKKIISDLCEKVGKLEEKVRVLSIENSALTEKVLTIRRLSKITEEDAAAWRNCEDFLNTNDQGSPTPVLNNGRKSFTKNPKRTKRT